MTASFRSCRIDHRVAERPLYPEARRAGDVVAQFAQFLLRVTLAQVDGEHPAVRSAAERGVFCIVVEDEDVAGLRFQRNSGDFATGNAPEVGAFPDLPLKLVGIAL